MPRPVDDQMLDPADTRFFEALSEVFQQIEGVDQTCRDLVDCAVATGDPADLRAARAALDGLEPVIKDAVFQQVHFRMATDISAILEAMQGAPQKQRPN